MWSLPVILACFWCLCLGQTDEISTSREVAFTMETRHLYPDWKKSTSFEFLRSADASHSAVFDAQFGSGGQIKVKHLPDNVTAWNTPCVVVTPNVSTIYFYDGTANTSGLTYTLSFVFTNGGDLEVSASGILGWSSNTSGKGVVRAKLLNSGTLVLFNSTNGTVWESRNYTSSPDCVEQPLPPGVVIPRSKDHISPAKLWLLIFVLTYMFLST